MAGLTPKQEAFCHAYIETGNASEAYRRAYPKSLDWKPETLWPHASKLLKNDKVATRLAELTERAVEKLEVTIETIAAQLDEDRTGAREADQFSAAIAATMGKAKLYGLITDKKQLSGDPDNPLQLNISSLMERIDGRSRALPEPRGPVGGSLLEAEPSLHDNRQNGEGGAVPDERRTDETLQ